MIKHDRGTAPSGPLEPQARTAGAAGRAGTGRPGPGPATARGRHRRPATGGGPSAAHLLRAAAVGRGVLEARSHRRSERVVPRLARPAARSPEGLAGARTDPGAPRSVAGGPGTA